MIAGEGGQCARTVLSLQYNFMQSFFSLSSQKSMSLDWSSSIVYDLDT